ncbi:MAG: hypothetical protein ORN49_09105, partial [Rhodobacteraceae bacterium]|nr:hypothetical protein [Paracoccaceae bacterium]
MGNPPEKQIKNKNVKADRNINERLRTAMFYFAPWVRAYWLPAFVITMGFLQFRTAVETSIKSTPHPALVYIIFSVAAVAAILFASSLLSFSKERIWLDGLKSLSASEKASYISKRRGAGAMDKLYQLFAKVQSRPGAEKGHIIEQAIDVAETSLMGPLALPNLLAGALVGLGLVGTFIGLLQTLDELSGVFSALGTAGGGGDAASLFTSMISRLQGPMKGMGTAFVASLYGLLGSLVISIIGLSVRRTGERFFVEIKHYFDGELYGPDGSAIMVLDAPQTPIDYKAHHQTLVEVIDKGNADLRLAMQEWSRHFDEVLGVLGATVHKLNAQLSQSVKEFSDTTRESHRNIDEINEVNKHLSLRIADASFALGDRIELLHREMKENRAKAIPRLARWALRLSIVSSFAVLMALAAYLYAVSHPDSDLAKVLVSHADSMSTDVPSMEGAEKTAMNGLVQKGMQTAPEGSAAAAPKENIAAAEKKSTSDNKGNVSAATPQAKPT